MSSINTKDGYVGKQFAECTAILALSGGMDSATLLADLIHKGERPLAVSFLYGSKHSKHELRQKNLLCQYYEIPKLELSIYNCFTGTESALVNKAKAIPEGHYEDPVMRDTVVYGRNSIFISIMMGLAQCYDIPNICIGAHQGDREIYADCRKEYLASMCNTVSLATEGKVQLQYPYIDLDKAAIIRKGLYLEVPFGMTRTCYKDLVNACGRCGSCIERLEAFHTVGYKDPVTYSFIPPEYESGEALTWPY